MNFKKNGLALSDSAIAEESNGFTLVELIIAAAITLVVGIFLLSILVNNNGLFYKQNALVSEGLSLNDSVSIINKNIMQASAIVASYPESTPLFTSNTETLILKFPSLENGEMVENTYDYIVFYKDTENPKLLKMQIFPDDSSDRVASTSILTTILQNIEFSYLDKNGNVVLPISAASVGVNLTVLAKTGSIGSSRSSTSITNLRNY